VKNDDIMKLSPVVYNTGINQSLYTELRYNHYYQYEYEYYYNYYL